MSDPQIPSVRRAALRGAMRRCPECGRGALFTGWMRRVPQCPQCGADTGAIAAEDGPAWLTILAIGPILVPAALISEIALSPPVWISIVLWPALGLALAALILPRAKGVFIGALWTMRRGEGAD